MLASSPDIPIAASTMSPMSPSMIMSSFVKREVDAVIGHPALRVVVGADALAAVAGADQRFAQTSLFACAASRSRSSRRGEHFHRARLVLMLRAAILTFHDHTGRDVHDAHGGVGLVDVLTTGPDARKVSMRRSDGLMVMSFTGSASGRIATVQALV